MLCIYHIADHDGKGSAAIVRSVYPEAELIGLNHDMEIPYEEILKHDQIVVCDISLPIEFMFELSRKVDFTWIDHHISVIEQYEKLLSEKKYEPIKGLRKVGKAAIMLTWEYFYPDKPMPLGIKLLGLNDVFDLRDKRVRAFEYAMQALGVNRPTDKIWAELINDETDVDTMVEKGRAILSYIRNRNFRLSRAQAFVTEFQGLKCICANIAQGYSEFYDSLEDIKDYDMMVNFFMNKKIAGIFRFIRLKTMLTCLKLPNNSAAVGTQKRPALRRLKNCRSF